MSHWQTSRFCIDLGTPKVMGIVNLSPDSFSDGGLRAEPAAALSHCEQLLAEGAHILDIGAESTRPGASAVDADEQWARLEPVLRQAVTLACPVSVDTSEPRVMRQALELGVDIVNDVRALRRPGALQTLAAHPTAGVCLMHMQGEPADMQAAPQYADVLREVMSFLRERLQAAVSAGIAPERIVLDPGYGFGKTLDHNLALARGQRSLLALGQPLLVGWSRKASLGRLTGRPVDERLIASVAAALAAVAQGASIVRVHDVAATIQALQVWGALAAEGGQARDNVQLNSDSQAT
jgi:dihydropteroate synthase